MSRAGHWWLEYNPSYLGGLITVQGQPGQIVHQTPIYKTATTKWTGGMAQVIEHLLCQCEALSSNPNPRKKEKKKVKGHD
jgi:hypothetical protein